MDNKMEDMTLHNLKKQVKEIDEKVAKLLTPEAQALFQSAYESALRDSPSSKKKVQIGFEDADEDQKDASTKAKPFDEEALLKKIEPLAPYERLNFLRSEFDLGRNPN